MKKIMGFLAAQKNQGQITLNVADFIQADGDASPVVS